MLSVLIVLDGSAVDARLVDLAGPLLAGRELELTLLHVVPVPLREDQGGRDTAVLEAFLDAEACGNEVAPLVEQLHASLGHQPEDQGMEPRLLPRHLILRGDNLDSIEPCALTHERRASMAFLADYAQRLRQRGIDMNRLARDSAIGEPAALIWETARHLGADLVIVGSGDPRQAGHFAEDPGWVGHAPCPVLVVPATDEGMRSAGSSPARQGRSRTHGASEIVVGLAGTSQDQQWADTAAVGSPR